VPQQLQVGDVITAVDGRPVGEIIEEREKYVGASNRTQKMAAIHLYTLLRTNDSLLRVDYRRDGEPMSAVLKTYPGRKIQFESPYRPDSAVVFVRPDIAVVNPDAITQMEQIDSIMPHVRGTKGLILDLRQYPVEFSRIADYLSDRKLRFSTLSKAEFKSPGYFTRYGFPFGTIRVGKRRGNRNDYPGKVVVLINEYSASSAEFHAMAFRAIPGVVLVGSNTAGVDGNVVMRFNLPGGISTTFSGLGVYYPDGGQTQRIGIVPDVEVKPTIEGIRQGRDELIEKAVEIIDGR
jgi:C-terminal processing protease CtpA/Prc